MPDTKWVAALCEPYTCRHAATQPLTGRSSRGVQAQATAIVLTATRFTVRSSRRGKSALLPRAIPPLLKQSARQAQPAPP